MWNPIVLTLIIFYFSLVQSKHFLGGTISWKATNNTNMNSIIPVMFTQSYQWTAAQTACNQSRIYNLPSVPVTNDTLNCVSNTSLCGGFFPLDPKGYCADTSIILNSRSTQISNVENITANSTFCVAFQSGYWRTIRAASCNFSCYSNVSNWSIGSCVNLTIRSEGFINTPPVATVISPILVPVNSSINITIPVLDADNDIVRCRWAKSTSILNECGDICGRIPGSTLSSHNCIFHFNSTGKIPGDYYAVALTIEDFSNISNSTPFSSVPVQFLIEIINISSCSLKPTISSNISNCTAIYVGEEFNFTLTVTEGCSNTTIMDFYAVVPLNMSRSNLTRNGTSNLWSITQTWMPTIGQLGSQVYCAITLDSTGIESDQYCLTFNVVSLDQDLLCPGEVPQTTTTIITASSIVTTAATAAPAQTVIQTIVVPDTSSPNYQFTSFDLALALGLGLPLLLAVSGLVLWKICCNRSLFSSSKFFSRNDALTKIDNSQTELNEKFVNENQTNQSPDYRQQYVNDDLEPQTKLSNIIHPLNTEKSLTSKSYSDFDESSLTITRTTFLSPSTHSFAANNAQLILNRSKSTQNHSVLFRAYQHQENEKAVLQ